LRFYQSVTVRVIALSKKPKCYTCIGAVTYSAVISNNNSDPWQVARRQIIKPLTRDVTVVCTLANSYFLLHFLSAPQHSDLAACRKAAKYTGLTDSYIFQPIAIELHCVFSSSALSCQCLTVTSGYLRKTAYFFQVSNNFMITQRFNSLLIYCTTGLFCRQRSGPLAVPTFAVNCFVSALESLLPKVLKFLKTV